MNQEMMDFEGRETSQNDPGRRLMLNESIWHQTVTQKHPPGDLHDVLNLCPEFSKIQEIPTSVFGCLELSGHPDLREYVSHAISPRTTPIARFLGAPLVLTHYNLHLRLNELTTLVLENTDYPSIPTI